MTSKNHLVSCLLLGTTNIFKFFNDRLESFGLELNACLMNMRFNLVTNDIQPYWLNPK